MVMMRKLWTSMVVILVAFVGISYAIYAEETKKWEDPYSEDGDLIAPQYGYNARLQITVRGDAYSTLHIKDTLVISELKITSEWEKVSYSDWLSDAVKEGFWGLPDYTFPEIYEDIPMSLQVFVKYSVNGVLQEERLWAFSEHGQFLVTSEHFTIEHMDDPSIGFKFAFTWDGNRRDIFYTVNIQNPILDLKNVIEWEA